MVEDTDSVGTDSGGAETKAPRRRTSAAKSGPKSATEHVSAGSPAADTVAEGPAPKAKRGSRAKTDREKPAKATKAKAAHQPRPPVTIRKTASIQGRLVSVEESLMGRLSRVRDGKARERCSTCDNRYQSIGPRPTPAPYEALPGIPGRECTELHRVA